MATATLAGATASVTGYGSWDRIIFDSGGAWTAGSTWTIAGTSLQGPFTLGIGYLGASKLASNYLTAITLNQRVYIGQNNQVAFSSIDDATGWNQQDPGAGFFLVQSSVGQSDSAYGLGTFQGRLAVLGRHNIQIWTTNADPAQFQLVQTLPNIGTISPQSVLGLGELDLLFLDDSGIRSLRTLVTTLNATVADVGSPVDDTVRYTLINGAPP